MGALCGLMSLLRGPEAGSSFPAATGENESKIRPGSGPHHSKAPPGIRSFKAPWEFGYFISKVVCISKVAIEAGAGRRLRGGGARAPPPLGTPCQAPGSFPPTRPDFSPVRSISSKKAADQMGKLRSWLARKSLLLQGSLPGVRPFGI